MKIFTFLCFLMLLTMAGSSGCTRSTSTPSSENQTIPASTTALPGTISSPAIQPFSTTTPPQDVPATFIPLKIIKDSELWFSMKIPDTWEVTTKRISNPEGYEGLVYDTVLSKNDEFHIITYAISRSQDQSFRNYYRDSWTPLPNESTVIINGITFDRFETKSDGNVKVAYVGMKSSANERGFASVIEYVSNSSQGYTQNDYESFISTFQYMTAKEIKSAPGEEIKR
jgi:hypothetical protein